MKTPRTARRFGDPKMSSRRDAETRRKNPLRAKKLLCTTIRHIVVFITRFLTTKHAKGHEKDWDNRSFCFRVFRVFRSCSILFLISLVATAPRRVLCGLALCCAAFLAFATGAAAQSVAATNVPPLRFGVSARTMADLNRTDVTAALKVWFETIAKERGIYADPHPRVFDSLADFAEALRREEIDVITAPSDEFIVLEKTVPLAGLYSTAVGGRITEEYVLLVRQDSPFRSLADLRDSRLIVLTHPSAGLAPNWLDTELLRNKLPVSARFFRGITRTSKMNRAILPVFFNQADACLATRRGFEVAGELNPQVLKALRVLAFSPPFVPGLGSYRANIPSSAADQYRQASLHLADTQTGKHILTLFQCDTFVEVSESEFAATRAFLAEYARLKAEAEREAPTP